MYDIDKIKKRMVERGLNDRRLARSANKSTGTIHRFFLKRRAHIDTVLAICKVLGLKVGSIIAETKRKNA